MAPLLSASAVSKYFSGKPVLRDISLEIFPGDVIVVIGPSGAGKSTLMRCLNLLDTPEDGTMLYGDNPIYSKERQPSQRQLNRYRQKVGMVFQDYRLWPEKTVLDNLIEAPIHVLHKSKMEATKLATHWLERFELRDFSRRYPSQLSGGEQQRVALARALMMEPEVLLLDEITSALDVEATAKLLEIIKSLAHQRMAMVIVTHYLEFARSVATRLVFMVDGRVIETGTPQQLLTEPSTERLREFVAMVRSIYSASTVS